VIIVYLFSNIQPKWEGPIEQVIEVIEEIPEPFTHGEVWKAAGTNYSLPGRVIKELVSWNLLIKEGQGNKTKYRRVSSG